MEWDPGGRDGWSAPTAATSMSARFVAMGNGPLHRPKLPGIPGIETFPGHSFHTSRWDYDYTGGDSSGGPGRARATSASASSAPAPPPSRCVPQSARRPSSCTSSSAPRHRSTCGPTGRPIRSGPPRCQPAGSASAVENFTMLTSGGDGRQGPGHGRLDRHHRQARWCGCARPQRRPAGGDLAAGWRWPTSRRWSRSAPGWTRSSRTPAPAAPSNPGTGSSASGRVSTTSTCRRSTGPTCALVDTDGRGVDRITPSGVVVGGREYPVDCLIFATGFEVGTDYTRRAGYDVVGVGGLKLSEYWSDGMKCDVRDARPRLPQHVRAGPYPRGLHGQLSAPAGRGRHSHVPTFSGTPWTTTSARSRSSAETEAEWVQTITETARDMRSFQEQCTPGYYNNEGRPSEVRWIDCPVLGDGPIAFFQLLDGWRSAGDLAGLELRP